MKLSTLFLFCLCLGAILKPFYVFSNDPIAVVIFGNLEYKDRKGKVHVVPIELGTINIMDHNKTYFSNLPDCGKNFQLTHANFPFFESIDHKTTNYHIEVGKTYLIIPQYHDENCLEIANKKRKGHRLVPFNTD